ncbi:MAG: thioredoxin family protein [Clostridium sp.]|nr:thioredoxin family protein [Prevotella sp.]MCM1429273.1 thioredoxin family protein [Clostridium sp.]MCM1475694.1 thioredoxin family protein [Muribaculaceae bacterium]
MKKLFFTLALIFSSLCMLAQTNAVDFSYKLVGDGTENPSLQIVANVKSGYHMYAQNNPPGGSNPLVITVTTKGCEKVGTAKANKGYSKEFDDVFEVDQYFYTGQVTFTQKLKATAKEYSVTVSIKGQACNDTGCVQLDGYKTLKGKFPGAAEEAPKEENAADTIAQMMDSLQGAETLLPEANQSGVGVGNYWDNVEAELKTFSDNPEQQERSLWYIFIAGFIGGLIALVTPCVWPMIPMTVSFFLKQNKTRAKSIRAALTYGGSIVVIYVLLGLLVTIVFGASALNELATSAVFNIIFFLLLVVFAISFMGGFELTLPASWTNKMDSKVDSTTGLLSLFFMAFTLVLVSFSCTGPIIGTLLVEAAATSNFVSPAIGMFGFSLALALPFSLFAMFPTMLKSMPKSGGWMNTVKVVLGFLELALALKFLSVADLAYGWRILDREVFVSLWIVIFALLGAYLIGWIRFPHDDEYEKTGVARFMLACVSFAFSIYMLPGLWGAPLKSISAFAPPTYTQDFSLYEGDVHAQVDDFDEGMALARQLNKPVLLDFSGYGCVNCRKMEAAVWTDPEVKSKIDNDFVLITLMVDEKKALPQPITVKEKDGTERVLTTYGDKWSYLQRSKFGANAQPFHVIVDNEGKPLNHEFVYKEDVPGYKRFLDTGKANYEERIK